MAALVSEQRVWRELTHFHFSVAQIEVAQKKQLADCQYNNRNSNSNNNNNNSDTFNSNSDIKDVKVDWQRIYHTLRR